MHTLFPAPLRFLPLLALSAGLGLAAPAAAHPALAALPERIVWAWERPEELRWLPADVGVAYVAVSLALEGDVVRVRPRGNRLGLRADTPRIPVVHVDASWRRPPRLSVAQRRAVVDQVLKTARRSGAPVVQLDFEVRRSQQAFLAAVVADLRAELPPAVGLSMTALASWCDGDDWLAPVAADEVVPMLFRMGADASRIRARLGARGRFLPQRCRDAVGYAIDEPRPAADVRRRYYFSPLPWTPEAWARIKERHTP